MGMTENAQKISNQIMKVWKWQSRVVFNLLKRLNMKEKRSMHIWNLLRLSLISSGSGIGVKKQVSGSLGKGYGIVRQLLEPDPARERETRVHSTAQQV